MKVLTRFAPLAFAAALLLTLPACNKDDTDGNLQPTAAELRHDTGNVTGPILAPGTHRFGVRFSESELKRYEGRTLTGIRIFVGRAPASLELLAYQGGDRTPGTDIDLIRAAQPIKSGGFYDYLFARPLPINVDQPLWLVAEVELDENQQSIGCDAGPAETGGDWLWSEDSWKPYRDRTSERVNWNIRGIVE